MKWLALGFFVFLAIIVTLADQGRLPALLQVYKVIPLGDKLGHFLLMGLFSLLTNLAFQTARWRIGRLQILKGSLLVAVVVTIEECSQLFLVNRSFSWSDLAADYAGILCFGYLACWWTLKRQRAIY